MMLHNLLQRFRLYGLADKIEILVILEGKVNFYDVLVIISREDMQFV